VSVNQRLGNLLMTWRESFETINATSNVRRANKRTDLLNKIGGAARI